MTSANWSPAEAIEIPIQEADQTPNQKRRHNSNIFGPEVESLVTIGQDANLSEEPHLHVRQSSNPETGRKALHVVLARERKTQNPV